MKRLTVWLFLIASLSMWFLQVHWDDFEIIPQTTEDVWSTVTDIGVGGQVRDNYDDQAEQYEKEKAIDKAFASGVFTRSLVLDYLVYLIRFLSQAGILIGAVMIIYAGYLYASSIFTGKEWGKKAITNAIIGVLVIAFSYAIIRIITSAFLS